MYAGFSGQPEFMFIRRTLSWVLVWSFILIWFWFLQVCLSSLVNNLGFSSINNLFLRVLILGFSFWTETYFDKKLWCLNNNRSKWILYSWSMLDCEQNLAFYCLKSGLVWCIRCWVWVCMFFIVLHVLWCLICFH